MTGACGVTVNVNVVLSLPPALVAVIVYVVIVDGTVGVPEILPVEVLNVIPVGNAVFIEKLVAAPPLLIGVIAVIAEPCG